MTKPIIFDIQGKRLKSLTYGRLTIDAERVEVFWDGHQVHMTLPTMLFVYNIARRPGRIRPRDYLLRECARATTDNERALDSMSRNARLAFTKVDPDFKMIQSVRGVGYRWIEDAAAKKDAN